MRVLGERAQALVTEGRISRLSGYGPRRGGVLGAAAALAVDDVIVPAA